MGKNSYTGGCLCGNIRYALTEPPLFVGTCHCRMCQKWTGRPMFASATFATSAVKVLFGSPKKYKSSEVSERFFCNDCGSSLFTRYCSGGAFDSLTHIMVGTLDNPEVGKPVFHYGAESELSWMYSEDGIPRISIDVSDPAKQNDLMAELVALGQKT